MMFKSCIAYRLNQQMPDIDALNKALEEHHCRQLQGMPSSCQSTEGWINTGDQYAVESHGMIMVQYQHQWKDIPASVLRDELQRKVDQVEIDQCRKVYRKEKIQLKDEVILDLLPKAFIKTRNTRAVITPDGWIFVDASSHTRAEELLCMLRQSLGSLAVVPVNVKATPSVVMTHMMAGGVEFTVGADCKLIDPSGEGGPASFSGHELMSDEVQAHIQGGYVCDRLALESDGQLTFTLHSDLTLRKLRMTEELAQDVAENSPEDEEQQLLANVWRTGKMLSDLYSDLISAMGGEDFKLIVEEDGE